MRQHDEGGGGGEKMSCETCLSIVGRLRLLPPLAASAPSSSPISSYCSSTSRCSTLPFSSLLLLARMLMAGHESLNTLKGSII